MGFTGGIVETDPSAAAYIGAEAGTNATAELSAIASACMYALQFRLSNVLIVYDAKYVANMASGVWTPGKNVDLANCTAELLDILQCTSQVA